MPRLAINLASAADRFRGGTGTFVDGLLDGLARLGDTADIVIVASPAAAARGAWLRPGTGWTQVVSSDPAAASFGFAAIGDPARVAALVRAHGIDVWFTPHTLPAPPVLPCATLGAILDVQHEDLPELYGPRERARRALVYETIARTSTRIVTLSAFSRDRIAARYGVDPGRLDVIAPGAPRWTDAPRSGRPPVATPYVLLPATTWRHKNHVTLIDALAGVRDRGIALDLVLTGLEGEAHPEVEARIAARELGDRVRWLGHVDEPRLRELYDGALAVAVPSRYEGFGLPVVEAWARGVPVLASDAASLPELTGDAALQVAAADVPAWTAALIRVVTDPALRERLAAAGSGRVSAFGLERAAERLLACADRAAQEGPRAVDEPVHVAPDRSFRGGCRYFLQVPAPATLDLAGQAPCHADWHVGLETRPSAGPVSSLAQTIGGTRLSVSFAIDAAPASLALQVRLVAGAPADVAHLSMLSLRLADGAVLDLLPALDAGAHEETLEESLARAVLQVRRLAERGLRRLALYGAGSHTADLIARLADEPARVVAVIDDRPGAAEFAGVRRVTPAAWPSLRADAVVLSSRAAEPLLAARAARWLPAGVPLVRLYTDESRPS